MSKYDSINTAADLVREVASHGLSMDQDDRNRAADIFGRTSIEELARLANDTGRNNANGEPDPKGTWSSSRRPTQGTFYFIAFNIWNWLDAVNFFNEHTNPATEERRHLANKNKELSTMLESVSGDRDTWMERAKFSAERAVARAEEVDGLKAQLLQKDTEITALKAKLYDLMMAGA